FSSDVTPRYCEADPYEGGKQAVAECWRNLTATGALPLAATDNLNFGNPERPEIMGQLIGGVGLIADWSKMVRTGFAAEGQMILLVGAPASWGTHLGQSVYFRDIHGR